MPPVSASQTETPSTSETINPSTLSSRLNGLTHGASAKELFINGEDPAEFDRLLESNFRYYKPTTDNEAELITDLTQARWIFHRRRRIADQIDYHLHTTKPDPIDWTTADLNHSNRFDRYVTTAHRAYQRALNNARSMHRDNLRTSLWKQLHELKKQKFAMQVERFEMAKAREKRVAENHEIRKRNAETKALVAIRSAKNAVPSPSDFGSATPHPTQTTPPMAMQSEKVIPIGGATHFTQ